MLLRKRWGRGELRPRWRRLQTSTTTSTVTLDTHEATLRPRGASVHTPENVPIVWHLLQPKRPGNRWRVRSRTARRPAFCDPSVSDGGASSWNRSNVTFAWWPQIAPVSIQFARGALILVSRRGYREAGAHLAARRGGLTPKQTLIWDHFTLFPTSLRFTGRHHLATTWEQLLVGLKNNYHPKTWPKVLNCTRME